MSVEIVFTAQGSNTALGNFAAGDRLRCGESMARHLVEEARVARYATLASAQPSAPPSAPPAAPAAGAEGDVAAAPIKTAQPRRKRTANPNT